LNLISLSQYFIKIPALFIQFLFTLPEDITT
jgi:hypothetical protein